MKNKLIFFFLFLILTSSFIITGAYYLLVLIVLFFILIIISFLSMYLFSNQIKVQLIEKNNQTYFIYHSKYFPIGKLSVHFNIENIFFEEIFKNNFELILGEKQISIKIPFNKTKLGKYKMNEQSFVLSDLLGLFKKNLKIEIFHDMIQYPTNQNVHSNSVSEEVIAYQLNKSDDYEIREYRIGDSIKDIHYKMSYKLSNIMIKEKLKNQGSNVSVYLDLSGNHEDCEKVFSYLKDLIQNLQIYHESCLVKWSSNHLEYSYKVNDMNDLKKCMTSILSMPKSKEFMKVQSTWIINSKGIYE